MLKNLYWYTFFILLSLFYYLFKRYSKKHENFDQENNLNDIALIKLDSKVDLNEYIQIACLPMNVSSSYPNYNKTSYTIGWGVIDSNTGQQAESLRNVQITVYDPTLCDSVSPDLDKNWDTQICAGDWNGGKDACQGDSGGSLFVLDKVGSKLKYVSVGITSYGDGCGKPNLAGFVYYYYYYYFH